MKQASTPDEVRRRLVRSILVAPIALSATTLLGLADRANGTDAATALRLTPGCDDGDDADPTESQTEGPFFKTKSPERTSLIERGLQGTPLLVTGRVLTRSCRPVANALLDFWHADDDGEYDNAGFRLRGHQFTDDKGVYRLETIVPGLYPGRTRHIHVKVQAPSKPVLATQLYFPGEGRNARDRIFDPDLLMGMTDAASRRDGRFNFVLDLP